MISQLQIKKLKKEKKTDISPCQKTFEKLIKTIDKLQDQLKLVEYELEQGLQFFQEKLLPARKLNHQALSESLKVLHQCYKNSPSLSVKERKGLKEFLSFKVNELLSGTNYNEMDPEICAIFQELEGMTIEEKLEIELAEIKKILYKKSKAESDLDVDLSHLKFDDTHDDIMYKFFDSMQEAHFKSRLDDSLPQKKTKKELEKEKKLLEMKKLQKSGLSTIYKGLAKEIHPDLEQNEQLKIEKEEWMKKLTAAYDGKDLYSLLIIQSQWSKLTNKDDVSKKIVVDESLKIYNSLLKNQIQDLKGEIYSISQKPRYHKIQSYFEFDWTSGVTNITTELHQTKKIVTILQTSLKKLKGKEHRKEIRAILEAYDLLDS